MPLVPRNGGTVRPPRPLFHLLLTLFHVPQLAPTPPPLFSFPSDRFSCSLLILFLSFRCSTSFSSVNRFGPGPNHLPSFVFGYGLRVPVMPLRLPHMVCLLPESAQARPVPPSSSDSRTGLVICSHARYCSPSCSLPSLLTHAPPSLTCAGPPRLGPLIFCGPGCWVLILIYTKSCHSLSGIWELWRSRG